MADPTEALVALLDLEPIEQNIYRGRNRDIGSGRIFGGQVLAQALVAARRTIDEADRTAHSLHAYFILEGDLEIPVVYFVDRLRDGRSFTTRRVTAIQHGRAIFSLSASFHRREEGVAHQADMPDVPPPEELRSEVELIREHADRLPAHLRSILTQDRPLEFRPVEPFSFFDRSPAPPAPPHLDPVAGPSARGSRLPPGRARVRVGLRAAVDGAPAPPAAPCATAT